MAGHNSTILVIIKSKCFNAHFFLKEPVEDVKTLYMKYLQVEISNRKQEMAYRALKMRKVEKEIQLLDRKLDVSDILIVDCQNKEKVCLLDPLKSVVRHFY